MREMEKKILEEGRILPGEIVLVDSFLNQQVDVEFLQKMADEWYAYFGDRKITKVMTVEASGISIATIVAMRFGVPLLFAKKYESYNLTGDRHQSTVHSYTKGKTYAISISHRLLTSEDSVLIIDDFLAKGSALNGLIDLVKSAGATIAGIGIAIEKTFQSGGRDLRQRGYEIYSLAQISGFDEDNHIFFEPEPII